VLLGTLPSRSASASFDGCKHVWRAGVSGKSSAPTAGGALCAASD